MDEFYDSAAAASALDLEAKERRKLAAENYSTTFQHLADLDLEPSVVTEGGSCRKNWRLCVPCEADGVMDEVVFGVQGILTNVGLVPLAIGKLDQKRAIRLAQRIEISGLNTATFEEALDKLESANDKLTQHFSGLTVKNISTANGRFGRPIAGSNRIFTLRVDSPTDQSTEFQPGLDPLGKLERLTSKEVFHGPDNVVKYYRRAKDPKNGSNVYDSGFPGSFRIGDIVEMQASIVTIKAANETMKLTCRLHALTMLDDSFTKAAAGRRLASKKRPSATVSIRCRVGHYEEVLPNKKSRVDSVDADENMVQA
ncbi:hypothetical protein B0H16DRAFT_1475966 [Mycena metata]|uniref:Uncharacterized protein n=1 Tax=Mycena metata TaxID=1033252 RepID=A0AAD7HE51_9AGAR|nr:hypothetical protein B0H16DRAFT_1482941 [Mycena metata]KAJ7717718.1 hypothetical protein B0H16DRAFT_1475966 [Mycena metata]